jgi:hypothetical protein
MITFLVITAFLAPSVLVVSACMLSSRLSQAEEAPAETYDTSKQTSLGLTSAHSHS